MNDLRIENIQLLAADLGKDNPLPPLHPLSTFGAPKVNASVTAEDAKHVGYGAQPQCLPYTLQDDYDRDKRMRTFTAAVLENDILRATFLIGSGGRLWSLYHKVLQRELLHRNPVFQPANLAVRNAWFSGGVEWNIGVPGHTPLTCSPLFAAKLKLNDGTPVLRMYEWERIRGVPWQIDCFLPEKSAMLFVRVRIVNPHDHEIPMYWWSNMAVDEHKYVRVLAPATEAFNLGIENEMKLVPVPYHMDTDISYTTNSQYSADYFFRIPQGQRPWITALDGKGTGLFQTSTSRLKTRKIFLWGTSAGGAKWQEFLSEPGQKYLEIQAGLAPTQAGCIPMPAGADWSWLEAYGLLTADPAIVHDKDWAKACKHTESQINNIITVQQLDSLLSDTAQMANSTPMEVIQRGSGWGALEQMYRVSEGLAPMCKTSMIFDHDSLTPHQTPWRSLLESGKFSMLPPKKTPLSYMIDTKWKKLLEDSVHNHKSDHWFAWLHLGVMYYHEKDFAAAKYAWETSISHTPSGWAYRNLAVLAQDEHRFEDAADLYIKACKLLPLRQLASECCKLLIETQQWEELALILDSIPEKTLTHGRIQMCQIELEIQKGNYDRAKEILLGIILPDIREAEITLGEIWFAIHEKLLSQKLCVPINSKLSRKVRKEFPLPKNIDFRMSEDKK